MIRVDEQLVNQVAVDCLEVCRTSVVGVDEEVHCWVLTSLDLGELGEEDVEDVDQFIAAVVCRVRQLLGQEG
jgi:hypothetical protein